MKTTTPIKAVRLRAGMSQAEVADAAGISRPHLSEIEAGIKRPSLGVAICLADVYRVPLDELVGRVVPG